MWIQEKQRNNRHDLHSTTASGKMPGTDMDPYMTFIDLTKAFDTVSDILNKISDILNEISYLIE